MNSALESPLKSTGSGAHWPWVWLVALLIALKSIYMGFDVTPPGDMPDESGHYSYAQDIANGKFFPLLGEATVRRDMWREPIGTERLPRENYIVQHPPLYYAVAAIPYAIAKQFTDDRWYLIRVTRTVSALSLGLLVLVLFKTIHEAGVGSSRALLVASSVAFIPMITNLSSGITNDIFLFLLCALATRHLVRFVQHQLLKDAYLCAFWLSMAGGTKMTAWILIAGFVCIVVYEMRRSIASWFIHSTGVTLVSLVLPIWWMGRNFYHFGNPFKVNVVSTPPIMLNYGLLDYLKSYPYLDWMLVHFYGLIGFSGYCQTPELIEHCMGVKSTRISSQPYEFMVMVLAGLSLVFVVYAIVRFYRLFGAGTTGGPASSIQMWISMGVSRPPWRWICLLLLGATGMCLYLYGVLHFHQEPGFISGLAKVMLLSACL
ncbi:MAG: hypothetical protein C0453_13710, partial [Comamonadaceae bacterium]|nr:hypothetical protein [Comamonadaceae bacterium]